VAGNNSHVGSGVTARAVNLRIGNHRRVDGKVRGKTILVDEVAYAKTCRRRDPDRLFILGCSGNREAITVVLVSVAPIGETSVGFPAVWGFA
jgi:hypothetical protein